MAVSKVVNEPQANYGGPWTAEKLKILEDYLNAYTTALKNTSLKLMYIDAFAGTGYLELDQEDHDAKNFIRGSASRAVNIDNKQFDKLIFVEKDPDRYAELENLRTGHPSRNIQLENYEANAFLSNLQENWSRWRGVLFLDPFATQVRWATIETIAGFQALDTWILFPTSAVARMLPRSKRPDDISEGWGDRLTTVYGDDAWRDLYREKRQQNLFDGEVEYERMPGVDGLLQIYKNKLADLLGDRFLTASRTLRNSTNSPLFEFLFFVGNRKGIRIAKKIAKHILDRM